MTSWAGTLFAGGAINSLYQGINSAIAGKTNYHYSKKLWDYQTRHQYQNMVYDLYKAGINPLMAVGGLHSSAGGTINASGGPSGIEAGTSAKAQMAQVKIAEKTAEADKLKAEAEVKEKEQNIELIKELIREKQILTPSQNSYLVAQTEFQRTMILKSFAEIDKIYSDISNNNRITDAQVTQLIEQAKHLRVITGNESINYDLLLRARDSKSEALRREYLSTWFGEQTALWSYMISDLTGGTGLSLGINSRGSIGFHQK